MKALLLRNFYTNKTIIVLYFIILISATFSNVYDNNFEFIFNVFSMSSVIPVLFVAVDSISSWNMYFQVLPVSRKQVVASKYIISLLTLFVTFIFYMIYYILSTIIFYGTEYFSEYGFSYYFNTEEIVDTVLFAFVVLLLYHAVVMFISFAFKPKSKIAVFIMLIIVFYLSPLITFVGAFIESPFNLKATAVSIIVPVVVPTALYALSWFLSTIIYQKRDL